MQPVMLVQTWLPLVTFVGVIQVQPFAMAKPWASDTPFPTAQPLVRVVS
jgi:hypothetical protein